MTKIDFIIDGMSKRIRNRDVNNCDRALYALLSEFKDKLPEVDHYFHKAFRQIDVTDSGNIDGAIYCLLDESELFWQLYGQYDKEIGKSDEMT